MYMPLGASRAREREAQNARNNRAEIVRALNQGEVTRRELVKWGVFTSAGTLALINGLSPFAKSAYADVPTGAPRSPLFGVRKFTQPLPRLRDLKPHRLTRDAKGNALFPAELGERPAKRLSYHTDFSLDPYNPEFRNPRTKRGPIEGRPPGEIFAHQRWDQYFPEVGYGGWDHPIHLHFEEGVTISRKRLKMPVTEYLVRKDVWRLGENGSVTFQVQFGEFGGAYVNHCHNTTHEDFGMLARIELLTGADGSPQTAITPTPNPTPDGVFFTEPEILREGDPRRGNNRRMADLAASEPPVEDVEG